MHHRGMTVSHPTYRLPIHRMATSCRSIKACGGLGRRGGRLDPGERRCRSGGQVYAAAEAAGQVHQGRYPRWGLPGVGSPRRPSRRPPLLRAMRGVERNDALCVLSQVRPDDIGRLAERQRRVPWSQGQRRPQTRRRRTRGVDGVARHQPQLLWRPAQFLRQRGVALPRRLVAPHVVDAVQLLEEGAQAGMLQLDVYAGAGIVTARGEGETGLPQTVRGPWRVGLGGYGRRQPLDFSRGRKAQPSGHVPGLASAGRRFRQHPTGRSRRERQRFTVDDDLIELFLVRAGVAEDAREDRVQH